MRTFFWFVKLVGKVIGIALIVLGLMFVGTLVLNLNQPRAEVTEVKAEQPAVAEATPVAPSVTPAPVVVEKNSEPQAPIVATSTCRHVEWLQNAINGTTDTSELLAVIDRDFVASEGGEWSEPGYTVRAGSVFWTDLLKSTPPAYVTRIRTEGNWGAYATAQDYVIPGPNGGGRHMKMCEGVAGIKSMPVAPAAPTVKPTCINPTEITTIVNATDPVASFNSFYEKAGYQYGKSIAAGEKIQPGLFLGTFPKDKIPTGIKDVAKGYIWEVGQEVVSVNGGRWMRSCK